MNICINRTIFATIVFFLSMLWSVYGADQTNPNILHLSFHQGCINDFQEVAKELSLEVIPWYILSFDSPREHFDGKTIGNGVYNITHERAEDVWNKHKDYFNQFDVILTSDTAPLSRIFLQNGWTKPLIIWVCNRFDYHDAASLDGPFPDQEYYDLIQKAAMQKNVHIVSYTPYEYHYAACKGVDIGTHTIKPLGSQEQELMESAIPPEIDKRSTIFIYPRLDKKQLQYISNRCDEQEIITYSGRYNGPEDLKSFKGVLYFPYAWSNLALFENLQRGIVHFVPTESFIKQERDNVRYVTLDEFEWVEWYMPEYRELFVYFDSWDDLKHKLNAIDYAAMAQKAKSFANQHRETMLARWQAIFDGIQQQKSKLSLIDQASSFIFGLFS